MSGARCFFTIMDDYSRFTWVSLMHHKHETQGLLKYFFSAVRTQFNTNIQNIRVDNEGEFISLKDFFLKQGTIYQRTCVYTPQQNGVVERKHRHILEVAWALRFQAHLPLYFWGDCIYTSVYLINSLPTLLLSKKTTFEKLHNKLPSYSHMKVFWCLAFATTVGPTTKFDPKAKKCVFLGYPHRQRAYKLYDLSTKKSLQVVTLYFTKMFTLLKVKITATPNLCPFPNLSFLFLNQSI